MKQALLLAACALFLASTQAQVVINEVASSNLNGYTDEDGDYPDWIEIYNKGAAAVDLQGYSITDNASMHDLWVFPDTTLNAGQRLIVYASGKNRNCLSCPVSPVDHWETAINEDDTWQYKNGTTEPPADWNDVTFTGIWSTGEGGFGYGDGDDNTTLPYGSSSYYYRKTFNVTDKSKIIKTILSMDYDDGFVAYINNVEIARINLVGIPTHNSYANYWHEALMYGGYRPKEIEIDSALMASLLVNGENVLAVEIHQYNTEDATGRTWLHFGISTPETFFGPNPDWFNNPGTAPELHSNFKLANGESVYLYNPAGILADSIDVPDLQPNHVRTRLPDGGDWCYSDTPTPMASKTGDCYSGYSTAPVIETAPGFYASSVDVTITGTGIHYTTDGNKPTETDDLYSTPISVSSTGVIKAIQIETGKLPSRVTTATYFIDEPTVLPVLSVSADPCDLFNDGPSCPAAYDNAEGWFNRNPVVTTTAEYYDKTHVKKFVNDFKFECVGNFSISLAQKSMRFVIDEDYGSTADPVYNIFQTDKPQIESLHGFRVRNMDQDYSDTRMKDIVANKLGLETHSGATAYQNVAVFINGEYWGMYGAREELDEYYLQNNHGVDPEKVDMIKTNWGGEEKTEAEVGSDTSYYRLIDYITGHDMSITANYEEAKDMIDVQNWVDYFATEMYIQNVEWLDILENNFRIYRSYEPDIKWRYIMWDCTNSQYAAYDNTLQGSLINYNNSAYADMFNALLDNTEFHDYFINRFADLMNYYFTSTRDDSIVNALRDEMSTEINAQNARWSTGSYSYWNSEINALIGFYNSRTGNQRNNINSYFGLDGQVNVTLDVNPPGAGFVKISTIMPQTLPWTGVYFDGVPVTVTAVANPGFTFVNWDDNTFIDDPSAISFTHNISDNTTFTANFNGSAVANGVAISEVNYNSDSTINTGDWVEIYNNSGEPADVTGYILSDKYFYNKFEIPTNTIIPAYGYLVLAEDKERFLAQHPSFPNVVGDFHFSLQNDSDILTLKDFSNNTLRSFEYFDDRPWPFTSDGYGRTMESKGVLLNPSLPESWFEGCVGGSPGEAYSPCFEDPILDEVNYKSSSTADAGDWFEIQSQSLAPVNIGGWILKDKNGNAFTIPAGTTIPAGQYMAFYQDAAKFNAMFPSVVNKCGPVNFGFDGNGDVILVYKPDGKLFQSLGFDDALPWPLSPDGGGTALQLVNPALNLNDPSNWTESCPNGSPGTEYIMPCPTGIETIPSAMVHVYPNPSSEFIQITCDVSAQNSILQVTDIAGKNMLIKQVHSAGDLLINISSLPAGMYTIRLQVADQFYTSSFIKE